MIVFIACCKNKKTDKCQAQQMYQGELFKKSLEYAKQLKPRKIYILSAKYHVLELEQVISPYNVTLNNMNKEQQKRWAYECYKQLCEMETDFSEECMFLCGDNYRKYLKQVFKNTNEPLKGLGIGQQLKYLKDNIRKER